MEANSHARASHADESQRAVTCATSCIPGAVVVPRSVTGGTVGRSSSTVLAVATAVVLVWVVGAEKSHILVCMLPRAISSE